jgi:hypothetical protein
LQRIQAHEKLTTRQRAQPMEAARPVLEIRSTHAAICPYCRRELRIVASAIEAHVHGGCEHFVRLEQLRDLIEAVFDEATGRKAAVSASGAPQKVSG